MNHGREIILLALASVLAGCVSYAAAPGGSPEATPSILASVPAAPAASDTGRPSAKVAERPVDATIAAVSLTTPSPDAASVLLACGATNAKPQLLAAIGTMGQVPHAKDVPKYTFLWGQEPELATDEPAWVIQFVGKVDLEEYWAVNPVCVSVGGKARIFAPEQYGVGDKVENPPMPNTPILSLPTPLP